TKKMTAVFEGDGVPAIAMLKGAPAVVLASCTHFLDSDGAERPLDEDSRKRFLSINEEMAGRALRVLAFADKRSLGDEELELENDFTFLGLAGMTDPPRAEVPEAIVKARSAGIRIVMITGDQLITAQAIARQLRLSEGRDVVAFHSKDLDGGADLAALARSAHVFARVSPEDKLRIVEALQQDGEIVAVTGDGINDAPALKRSDIGVAMGKRGTDVAKEAADIVLTDDNFSTIIKAVEGGRTIYSNIIKFVHMMFSHNLAEVLVIFCAIVAGLPLPLLPLQILWINLVTDIFPALALAVEPATPETMMRRPRSPKESLLSARFMFLIGWQGVMLAAIALGAYAWSLRSYGAGAHAHTVALLAVVAVQAGHLFYCRSRSRSAFYRFFTNPFIFAAVGIVVLLQVLAMTFTPLMKVLGTVTPTWADWISALLCLLLPIAIVEITKLISRSGGSGNSFAASTESE
ncbi:MAG TPA: HAD-IC family P-type ATPase, partial [Pyrinomonadaceae bacterium]|nr:HAD-IC family P-type ATPase [Pyrinomonadaceae bacterium]